ncbi:dihydropteroate synthase [Azoarcus sp. KH32C]|uniref:dihydropteroate synthase n=1 Tax=Azoarcus sp. KH32C TaxID=748247 RepID=UPI0002386A82|nr:dihydropteroate synthase [Azoarcus sp. KH32C]BAL25374.1 dihydropteroate synthase [Azoarcus sp. KH32C]
MQFLQCGRFRLDLEQPRIMAIINTTPDSFSGDGVGRDLDLALRRAELAVAEGAHLLDLGGESSRPGADPVSEQEELDRVVPLVERLADWPVPVSVDTFKPEVMRAVLAAGASLVNDINGFRAAGAVEAVHDSDAALCVMHMKGEPRNMQKDPQYDDVVSEVLNFLEERVGVLLEAGIARERLVLDPGFGFGKTLDHNLALMRALDRFVATGYPQLIGVSRKTMIGTITGRPTAERVTGSVAAAMICVELGARIVRVHDVAQTRDALEVWQAVRQPRISAEP